MSRESDRDAWPHELERALAAPPPAAPARFTERVMERVADARRVAQVPAARTPLVLGSGWLGAPALEWWVRAAADPAVALALALAAVLLWRADAVVPACEAAVAWVLAAPHALALPVGGAALEHAIPHGVTALALALALLPAVGWGSWRLGLWLERTGVPGLRAAGPR
jgi:hypothetical protein